MLERLSHQSIQTIMFAEQEMRSTGHGAITPAHLLLGFLTQSDDTIAYILARSAANADSMRDTVHAIIGNSSEHSPKEIRFTENAHAVIACAEEIASFSGVFYVSQAGASLRRYSARQRQHRNEMFAGARS